MSPVDAPISPAGSRTGSRDGIGIARSVLVTGASTGIGEATARRLDRAGWRVYAGVRRDEDAAKLRAACSERVTPLRLDVTDAAAIDAARERIADEVGVAGLQGLVNNAGIASGCLLEFIDADELRRTFEVNVIGPALLTRALLPLLRTGGGRVVHIGSQSGFLSAPFVGSYSASKHALEALADTLRRELRPWRIPVALVQPGAIRTAIWGKARAQTQELRSGLSAEAHALYAPCLDAVSNFVELSDRLGADADRVARAVEHALASARPRTRYRVGLDARAAWWTLRLLPDRWVDALLRLGAGLPDRL